MTIEQKINQNKGKAGKAGIWTASGFIPSNKPIRKPITLLQIILGKR